MLPSSGWRTPFGRDRGKPTDEDQDDKDEKPAGHYGPSFRPGEYLPGYPAPGYAPDGLPRLSLRRVERLPVRRQVLIAMLGAVTMLIGSLMNWATGTQSGLPVTVRGTELDGQVTLTAAVLVLMFGVLVLWRTILGVCVTVAVLGAGASIVALIDRADIRGAAEKATAPDVHLSVAAGLWIVFVAGIVVCAAGISAAIGARRV